MRASILNRSERMTDRNAENIFQSGVQGVSQKLAFTFILKFVMQAPVLIPSVIEPWQDWYHSTTAHVQWPYVKHNYKRGEGKTEPQITWDFTGIIASKSKYLEDNKPVFMQQWCTVVLRNWISMLYKYQELTQTPTCIGCTSFGKKTAT